MLRKLPTAWLQLRHQKIRFLVALTGVIFSVVIFFMQLGLLDALYESAVRYPKSIQGDCFLISSRTFSLVELDPLTDRRLSQLLAFPEVEYVAPVYASFAQWKNPDNAQIWRNIFILGFDLRYPTFNFPGVQENLEKLKIPDTVIFDKLSLPDYGSVVAKFQEQGTVSTEVRLASGKIRQVEVVGLFELGTSFGVGGNLITSSVNYMRIMNQSQKGLISIGVIKLKSGIDPKTFASQIRPNLPEDVKIFSREDFLQFEKDYWRKSSPIGFIFSLGVILGLIIGIVIVYQILYTNVSEHLPQYATLKAIGYQHSYLLGMVLQQSIFIAILGYIPGWLLSELLYDLTRKATLLEIGMTLERSLWIFVLTFAMCFISGAIAVRKLKDADPADIF